MEDRTKERKTRDKIIIALLISVIIMAVAYLGLAAELDIQGTHSNGGIWKMDVASIKRTDKNGGGKDIVVPFAASTTLYFNVEFTEPGQFAEYDVSLRNSGNLDAYLNKYIVLLSDDKKIIKYTVTGAKAGDLLRKGEMVTVHVRVEWDKNYAKTVSSYRRNIYVVLDYIQAN